MTRDELAEVAAQPMRLSERCSRELADPTASVWHESARQLLRALDVRP